MKIGNDHGRGSSKKAGRSFANADAGSYTSPIVALFRSIGVLCEYTELYSGFNRTFSALTTRREVILRLPTRRAWMGVPIVLRRLVAFIFNKIDIQETLVIGKREIKFFGVCRIVRMCAAGLALEMNLPHHTCVRTCPHDARPNPTVDTLSRPAAAGPWTRNLRLKTMIMNTLARPGSLIMQPTVTILQAVARVWTLIKAFMPMPGSVCSRICRESARLGESLMSNCASDINHRSDFMREGLQGENT